MTAGAKPLRHTRPIVRVLLLLIPIMVVIAVAGWVSHPTAATAGTDAENLQRRNRFRILFTSNTLGYIDPCDCSAGLLGGLDKKTAAIRRNRDIGRPTFLLDLGNLFEVPRIGPTTELGHRQAAFLSEEMIRMGYQLVALGAKDLSMEPDFLAEHLPVLENQPLLTNRAEGADISVETISVFRLEIAGLKLDFFNLVDPNLVSRKEILTPWESTLRSALAASTVGEDPADLQVVIIHTLFRTAEAIPGKFPEIDVLLDGEMLLHRQAFRRENTICMSAASKGQRLAVLDITGVPKANQREGNWVVAGFQGRHISLPPGAASDTDTWQRMRAFKAELVEEGLIPPG